MMKVKNNDFRTLITITGLGALIFIIITLILSALIASFDNSVKFINYAAIASAALAGLSFGFISKKMCDKNALSFSSLSGGILALILIVVSLLFGDSGNFLLKLIAPIVLFLSSFVIPIIPKSKTGSKDASKRIKQLKRKRA